MKKVLALSMLLLAWMATAQADSWAPPRTHAYVSADGAWRLTVKPRDLTSALDFFKDKVADRPKAGGLPGDAQASAMGRMEHREDGKWRTVWGRPLVNDVSPVDALVSKTGRVVTFDNWHGMGYGTDVIAIYDGEGKLVRQVGLSDFLPSEYIRALPHSVSSIEWSGEARLSPDDAQVIVPVVVPSADGKERVGTEKAQYIDIRFDLRSGQQLPAATDAWNRALASARAADRRLKEDAAAARHRFLSPLAPPASSDTHDWYAYLVEAFFRLDPDWADGYPSTHVIPLASDEHFDLICRYVGEALSDKSNSDGAIMVASPSQDLLVKVLNQQVKSVKPGSLLRARLYVPVDQSHREAVRMAVARTGIHFIPIDLHREIPQRPERLKAYLKNSSGKDE